MDNFLKDLFENKVCYYFNDISNIPRGSGNEKAISDYLVNFAKKRNLKVVQDKALNIIIKENGSKGYENAPTVILQGHMDMVCEKNTNIEHDFNKEPLKLDVEGDFIKASGTTLGADNGIAIAYCLAILDTEDVSHPPLEVLFTTEEETGMRGATKLNKDNLSGKILINIDSEKEGELLSSCAGGIRNRIVLKTKKGKVKEGFNAYSLKIKGLQGGHSGTEIDKGRGNANKIMGRILNDINSSLGLYVSEINGGAKMNAIPREAEATILVEEDNKERLKEIVGKWKEILKNELKSSDKDIDVELSTISENVKDAFTKDVGNKIIEILILIPDGIQSMSMNIKGLVQSSINLGIVTTKDDKVMFESAIRSSVKSLKYEIVNRIEAICNIVEADMSLEADYPEWEYNDDSYIRNVFVKVHKDMYKKEPKITAIHAGLECGILKEVLGDMDMISFGPNMYDVHTPKEKLSISSAKRTFAYLLNVLKEIK